MRILYVISSVRGYGAEKMLLWVADQMARLGHDVAIYTYDNQDQRPLGNDKITHINEPKKFKTPLLGIRRFIKEWRPDCVTSFKLDANVFATIAALGTHVPVVICERLDPYTPGYWKLKLSKFVFNFSGAAVFQLDKVRDYYKPLIHGPMAVIPNPVVPIEAAPLTRFADRKNEIVCVARLDLLNKRQDILIRAFAMTQDKLPEDTKLVFYGTGDDEGKIRQLSVEQGIDDQTVFLGKVHQPYNKYRDSKLFVMASDHEGIPNALIEAMSIGMTCISTDMSPGGAELLIQDKVNGMLVPREDPQAMADAILYCFGCPDDSDRMGVNAKTIADKFNEAKIASMWDDFYKRLYASRHN